jgi:hypothetical protein
MRRQDPLRTAGGRDTVSNPKPHIRPKSDPQGRQDGPPLRDPPTHPEHDPPVFAEFDPGTERKAGERVLFQEDDRLG